jgi:membrane protease YdiL (CAAX protease family)
MRSLAGHLAPHPADFKTYPGALEEWSFPLVVIVALLLNGLGEEAGWRGFALARYAQRQKPLQASLCVAAIWMLWHAPLFVLNASMVALLGPALLGWALGLAAGAVVLAWLYLKTDSILVPALWHTGFNFMVATVPGRGLVAAILSTVVMVLALVIARRWVD